MKKFGFSLPQELYSELKRAAQERETSMAAVCREALTEHFRRREQLDEGHSLFSLFDEGENILNPRVEEERWWNSSWDFPELEAPAVSEGPKWKPTLLHKLTRKAPKQRSFARSYDTRWLDELWA